jgi:hypothetical protein
MVEAGGSTSQLVRCSMREVARHAQAPATVIAVVDDDLAAREALGAGVDEVVLKGDLNDEELARAAESAVARAQTPEPPFAPGQDGDEGGALGTLLDWLAIELVTCLSSTVLEGDLLEENVRRLFARQETGTAADEFGPSEADTLEMVATVRGSFRRMQEVLFAVRALGGPDGPRVAALATICQSLSRVLQSRALPIADIDLDVDPTCGASIRPAKLVGALVILVESVLDRATRDAAPRGKRVRVMLRARSVEGAAIVEVEDDLDAAGRSDPHLRPSPVTRVRNALRGDGAEVQVASAPGRTTVRLVLPRAELAGGAGI